MNILRDKWPCSRRAAEQRDELATFHRPVPPVLSTESQIRSFDDLRRTTALTLISGLSQITLYVLAVPIAS
jgi:hypothetical protein